VAITVADTGIGIPAETRARVFEAISPSGKPGAEALGVGLGLALSRDLVAALGGRISLESESGHGTSVTFTVPLAPGDPARTAVATPRPPEPLPRPPAWRSRPRVLVVESNAISREVLGTLLRHFGCEAVFAGNGPEALAAVSSGRFDLALIASQLPGTDGYETAREIRRRLPIGVLPIIALSASSSPGHVGRAQEAGMNDTVTKPFRAVELLEALRLHLASRISPEGVAAPPSPGPDDLVGTGMPSGGIAPRAAVHDINNALTGLLGYADLLAMGLKSDSSLKKYADRIVEAGERARQILLAMPRG
jgi:CheY-like chemotaxis protein